MTKVSADAAVALPARTRILRATLELIAEGSIDAVTHRAIARRAGVSPGSTTHHFSSRDDLVHEAFRHYLERGEEKITALVREEKAGVDPLRRARGIITQIASRDFASGLVRAEYQLLLYASSDPELAAEVRAWEARLVAVLAELLERGGVSLPVMTARTLINLTRGFELESMLDPSASTADFEARLALVLAVATTTPGEGAGSTSAPAGRDGAHASSTSGRDSAHASSTRGRGSTPALPTR